jgi:flagellar secretion chaperone FliS
MSLDVEAYVARISSATPVGLIIINYELAIHYICEAIKYSTEDDVAKYKNSISKGVGCVEQLLSALDMKYDMSRSIAPIYIYINRLLNNCLFNKNINHLKECNKLLTDFLDTWKTIEKNDISATPVLQSSQKVYAGLTYKNGKLDEFIQDTSFNKYEA